MIVQPRGYRSKKARALAAFIFLLTGSTFLVGCFKAGPAQSYPPISISLTSSITVPLAPGQATVVTAAVYDQNQQGVTWTISPLNFGTLSDATPTSVTYTAPSDLTTSVSITITATSITNSNITASIKLSTSPISVSLSSSAGFPLPPQTLSQGGQFQVFATVANDFSYRGVTWTISPASGEGTLTAITAGGTIPGSATYVAPSQISSPINLTVTATAVASPTAFATLPITVLPGGGPSVAALTVDAGPVPGQVSRNHAFTSITLCNPGSVTACQIIDGLLVDTGSYGLRVLQSEIPLLKLPTLTNQYGQTLENCFAQPNGSYLWGPVSTGDIYIAGQSAPGVNVQVINSSPQPVPTGCSNGGAQNPNTPELLGANGILGIGPEPTDCTLSGVNYCDGSTQSALPNIYYACFSGGCNLTDTPVIVSANQQVQNPVAKFSNGVILQLPAVSSPQTAVVGTLTFGIAGLGNASIYTLDTNDHFSTVFNGQTMTASYIDSGANALFFPDNLPVCQVNSQLFCPSSVTSLSATIKGSTQGQSVVNFSVGNADELFSSNSDDAAFGNLAGPEASSTSCASGSSTCAFVWGLPFFYGRSVFEALDGVTVAGTKGPWWAF